MHSFEIPPEVVSVIPAEVTSTVPTGGPHGGSFVELIHEYIHGFFQELLLHSLAFEVFFFNFLVLK